MGRVPFILVCATLVCACTPAFLKPDAVTGTYSYVNPACGGNLEVLEFSPPKQGWFALRVYAKQTHTKGTALMIGFRLKPCSGLAACPGWFSDGSESDRKIRDERLMDINTFSASKASVTVERQDGPAQVVLVPLFQAIRRLEWADYTWWPAPVQIAPVELDEFTVKFPDFRVNDELLQLPPVHFKKDAGGQFYPVVNC